MIKKLIGQIYLKLAGWRCVGTVPEGKCVIIAAPHTSNWDTPHMLAIAFLTGVKLSWIGKHTLFKNRWANRFFRWLGGIPIRRHLRQNVVQQMAEVFDEHEELILAVSPEGTRGRLDHWKSGFYYIALTAKVPICLGYLDYSRKIGGFGPCLHPTGNVQKDMDRIRAFYIDKKGKHPEQFGPVRLKDEPDLS